MSLDLNKLENKLDEALIKETTNTLTKFLNDKRMKNEKKQTAVDWLFLNLKSHFEHDGDLLEVVQMSYEQAKEMEYQQMIEFGAKCIESQNETYGGENAE